MKPKTPVKTEEHALMPVNTSAEALIAKAIDNKIDVATMERLLEMRRQVKQEWAKEEFDKAMAAFQSKCPTIERRKQGYNYKYAPLESIVEQVKDLLSINGFSYTFDTEEADNAVVIFCKVKHIAGHSEVSKATIKKETTTKMNASQQSGAAMTYGKRYAFVNAFGILTGDEDTDAQQDPQTRPESPAMPSQDTSNGYSGNGRISYKQSNFIRALLPKKGYTEKALLHRYEVINIGQLTSNQASQIIENLQKLPDKKIAEVKQEELLEEKEGEQIAEDVDKALS